MSTQICLLLLLSSCSGNPAAGEARTSNTPALASDSSPSASSRASSPTPTPADTPTEQPPTATPAPAGLSSSGPYAVFEGDQGIWIANPDGSFLTRIAEHGIGGSVLELRSAISPRGDRIVLLVSGEEGIDLAVLELPGGEQKTVARLIDITRRELAVNSMTSKAFAYYAITEFPGPAWQPAGGETLAYVGAGSDTADIYTYDFTWEKTRHVEKDPSQAIHPIWSPDGRYLLYFGVEWLPPYGPARITFEPMKGFWGVEVSDNRILPQKPLKGTHLNFTGWLDETQYLAFDSGEECLASNLRAVDLLTGEESPIADFCFSSTPAWSPTSGAVLFAVDSDCGCEIGEGVFLILPGRTDPIRLLEKKAFELLWLPESDVFYAYPETLFSADGSVRYDPPVKGSSYRPAVSKAGHQAWVVLEEHRSRVMLRPDGGEWRDILEGNVSSMLWDPVSGETLLIVLNSGELFSAAAPDFTPRLMGNLGGYYDQASWSSALKM